MSQDIHISVITTLYNYSQYINDCIVSFIKQGLNQSEMVIIDDGSTDNPEAVIEQYTDDTRIKYMKLGQNYGYSYAKNVGIKNSSYETLVMLDADDMLTENSLSSRYELLQSGFDFVHGPVLDLKGEIKKPSKLTTSKLWKQWTFSNKDASCYRLVHAQSVMLRKQIHREIGLYDETLRHKSDREMWARIFNHNYKIGYVSTPVSIYRIHKKQMSRSPEKLLINDKLQETVLNKIEQRKRSLADVELLNA